MRDQLTHQPKEFPPSVRFVLRICSESNWRHQKNTFSSEIFSPVESLIITHLVRINKVLIVQLSCKLAGSLE